jgi:hypothetical protein
MPTELGWPKFAGSEMHFFELAHPTEWAYEQKLEVPTESMD